MRKMYVVYWNPNGTNDLILTKDGMIVEVIPEALFGVSVEIDTTKDVLVIGDQDIEYLDPDSFKEYADYFAPVQAIGKNAALSQIACSPVDSGADIAKKIKEFFE